MGNNKHIDKMNICKLLLVILFNEFLERNPPDDTVVKAKLNESKSLTLNILKITIIKIVVKPYIMATLKKLYLKLLKKFPLISISEIK